MNFTAPLPFTEALQSRQVRSILRTSGNTADLARLEPAVRERAIFSATVTSAELLDKIDRTVTEILTGQTDQATARLGLKDLLDSLGYRAGSEKSGTLQDLRGDRRLDLILETNTEMARGYGQWLQGQQADVLDEWPAQELIRVRDSEKPRPWVQRWIDAGGVFRKESGNRMIALKNDPLWSRLSRFGTPYPPFDFNSGMNVREIVRDEAESLGLLDAGTVVFPQDRDFNADLQASPTIRANWLVDALEESGVGEFGDDGVFHFKPGGGV